MGAFWLKNQRSRDDLQKEVDQLRKKNLKLRLDMYVLVLTPNSRRAQIIREENYIKVGAIGNMTCSQPKGQPAEVFFR